MSDDLACPNPATPPSLIRRPGVRRSRPSPAATGLAIATVSRALKDAPDIGEDTKRRVRETAALLGYRPNRAGVRLRTGKTNVIALVLSTEADVMNHTSRLIYSIANALRGTAYHMVVMPYFPDQDPMDPIRYIVETESADGIILNQTKPDDPRIRYMTRPRLSLRQPTAGPTWGSTTPISTSTTKPSVVSRCARWPNAGGDGCCWFAPPRAHLYARHMTVGFADEAALLGLRFEVAEGSPRTVAAKSSRPVSPAALPRRTRRTASGRLHHRRDVGRRRGRTARAGFSARISTWWPKRPSPSCDASDVTSSSCAKTLGRQAIFWPTPWSQQSRNGLWPNVRGLRFQTR